LQVSMPTSANKCTKFHENLRRSLPLLSQTVSHQLDLETEIKVLLHNGGSWNACTIKRCIPKQST
jgi:hypothetical protein